MSDAIRRQLRQRLDGLRQAGVEFVPRCEVPPRLAADLQAPALVSSDASVAAEPVPQAPTAPAAGPRRQELALLAQEVAKCKRCPELASTRTQTVFGVGPLDPEVCFIGEAPGADEDREGEPFVGAAGQLLNKIIAAMGMKREEVFICNILRCRPPGNRTPKKDEADLCRDFLERTLELVRPKFICTLGGTAAMNLLGSTLPMGKLRGKWHDYKGIPVICTYHPAFLLPHRSPEKKKEVWEDMKVLLSKMGRSPPGGTKGDAAHFSRGNSQT
jgi:DNA polymerase